MPFQGLREFVDKEIVLEFNGWSDSSRHMHFSQTFYWVSAVRVLECIPSVSSAGS